MCSQPYFIPEAANNFTQMCIRHYSNSAKLHWERQVQVYRIRALFTLYKYIHLGMPPFQKSAVFFNIVQKAFAPPPPFI